MVVKTNRQTFQTVMANKKKGGKATEALKKELEKKKLKEEEEEMELEDSDDEMDEEDSDFDSDLDDEEDEDEDDSLEEESEDEKPAKGKNALATKSPGKTATPVQKKQDKLLTPAQKKKAETPKGKGQTPVAKKGMEIKEMEEQEDDDKDGDEDDESFEDEDESGEDKKVVKDKPMTPAQRKIQGKQQMSAQKKIQGKADTPSQKKTETPKGFKRKGQDVKDQNAKKTKGLDDDEEEEEDDDDDESFEEDEDEDEESEEDKPVKGKKSLTPAQKKKQEMSAQKKIQGKAGTPSLKKNEKTETPKGVKRKRQDDAGVDAKKTKDLDDEAHRLTEERIRERNYRTLFIGQLPASTTVDEVKALSPDITNCRIPMRSSRKGTVYAFAEFSSEKKAEENYEKLQKKTVSGKQIVIDYTGEKSSNYKKSPVAKKTMDKKVLFIGGVASDITVEDLAKVFPNSAQVDFSNPPGSYPGRNVYVKFDTEEAAKEAFLKAENLKVKGNSLTVLFAHAKMKPKNVNPRRKDFGKRSGPRKPKFQTKKQEESDNDSDDE
ncbi:uncharacterized protein LOC143254369 isoform X1 [Tachypleus tridentatus]|uniref:uncharacterized protein LOC143254369 isoform X1 n=1 Tax=Tachypleus tridentatus TaxID=6853 RepID=UPI003FD364E1